LELVDSSCGPVSFGDLLSTFRMCDEMSQAEFAEMLGVSASYISGIENGDRLVSPETAAACAAAIGYPATVFVERALQDQLDRGELKMKVCVEDAEDGG
jgi:transcriptional regulator with XRE-family HTH domain